MKPLKVMAAFDIGSNSIKMTAAQQLPDGSIREIVSQARTTRLGAGIESTGRLSDESMRASLEALTEFVALARQFGATRLIGVATEAARVATNGEAFLDRVRHELGIEIKTITGNEEAALTFLGLPVSLRSPGTILAADIGGASTEVIAARSGTLLQSTSYPVGSGRLTDRLVPSDPPLHSELAAVRESIKATLGGDGWPAACDRLLVLGGTGEYLRVLLGHDWPATTDDLPVLLDWLTKISARDLAPQIQASDLRARVLPAGIAIVAGLSDVCLPTSIIGAPSGIRMGLLQSAFEEVEP